MSAIVKSKPEKATKRGQSTEAPKRAIGAKQSDILLISGPPRVHLLPPEVHERKKSRELRRRLGFGLVGAIVLVAIATGLATVSMFGAQAALVVQQDQASSLASQAVKYSVVTRAQTDTEAIKHAQTMSMTNEVSWAPYIANIQKTLSPGMTITDVKASLEPSSGAPPLLPLQGPRVATLDIKVTTPQASIEAWLNQLPSLKGFVDATPGSVSLTEGQYTVDVVIHINKKALANRFVIKTGK
jgi:hypothetical protein